MFNIYDKGQAGQLYNEILLLTSFQCDALISLKGAFHDEGSIGVIIEYMDKGSLEFIMDEKVEITEQVMAAISFQILWGLGYLHYEKQIHRDVKPGNILMVLCYHCIFVAFFLFITVISAFFVWLHRTHKDKLSCPILEFLKSWTTALPCPTLPWGRIGTCRLSA